MAVIFSEGFHRPDEHLGVIHFMTYKLGTFPKENLSWEFPTQIRNAFMPWLFFIQTKVLNFLGIQNPFTLAFFYRLFSSLLGFLSLLSFSKVGLRFFNSDKSKKIDYKVEHQVFSSDENGIPNISYIDQFPVPKNMEQCNFLQRLSDAVEETKWKTFTKRPVGSPIIANNYLWIP